MSRRRRDRSSVPRPSTKAKTARGNLADVTNKDALSWAPASRDALQTRQNSSSRPSPAPPPRPHNARTTIKAAAYVVALPGEGRSWLESRAAACKNGRGAGARGYAAVTERPVACATAPRPFSASPRPGSCAPRALPGRGAFRVAAVAPQVPSAASSGSGRASAPPAARLRLVEAGLRRRRRRVRGRRGEASFPPWRRPVSACSGVSAFRRAIRPRRLRRAARPPAPF